jgi:hypothetical protein
VGHVSQMGLGLCSGHGSSSHCTKVLVLIKDKFCGGNRLPLYDTWLLERNTECAGNYWKRSFRCVLHCSVPETLALWEGHVSFRLRHLSKYYIINYGRALECFDESLILVSVGM